MSKSSKPSEEFDDVAADATGAEATTDGADDSLGITKKTKDQRDAEKAEARREADRENLRRRTTPQPVKLDSGGKNPRWWVPTMLTLMVTGLLWLVVYYLGGTGTNDKGEPFVLPIPALGVWNMGVGFALIMVGFVMTTRWK